MSITGSFDGFLDYESFPLDLSGISYYYDGSNLTPPAPKRPDNWEELTSVEKAEWPLKKTDILVFYSD